MLTAVCFAVSTVMTLCCYTATLYLAIHLPDASVFNKILLLKTGEHKEVILRATDYTKRKKEPMLLMDCKFTSKVLKTFDIYTVSPKSSTPHSWL